MSSSIRRPFAVESEVDDVIEADQNQQNAGEAMHIAAADLVDEDEAGRCAGYLRANR